jgi:uncharacterized protein
VTGTNFVPEVWLDGDSCPVPVRDLLVRWHQRGRLVLRVFANRSLPVDSAVEQTVVGKGSVDEYILNLLGQSSAVESAGDPRAVIVVTRDIPFAEACLEFDCTVMNDRGTVFSPDGVRERRSIRDANARIREMGLEEMNRRRSFGNRELKRFSDALDRVLSSLAKGLTL